MTEPHLEHSIFGGQDEGQHRDPRGGDETRAEPRARRAAAPRKRGGRGRRIGVPVRRRWPSSPRRPFAAYTVLRPVGRRLPGERRLPGPGLR